MYKEILKNKVHVYEYDGDFEQYLLNLGVDHNHIVKMKNKILETDRDIYYVYEKPYKTDIRLVSLEKVIGTTRSTPGLSVYENVRSMESGDREPARFRECFSYLDVMSLNQLRESYQDLYRPIEMTHYLDDNEYFVTNDGNHRTLIAMLLGASLIKASVSIAKCDFLKKEKVSKSEEFYRKYAITRISRTAFDRYNVTLKYEEVKHMLCGYEKQRKDESCFELINRLSAEIESDLAILHITRKTPSSLRSIVFSILNTIRTRKCYEILVENEQWWDTSEQVIHLYNL